MIALCIAVSWAAGTVYVKWARMTGDPVANAAWQVVIAFFIVVLLLPFFEGTLHLSQAHKPALAAAIFAGLMGSGLAYFLWFGIIGRVSAMTASLGVLSAPVIGVVSTALLLGEIPTLVRHRRLCADLRGVGVRAVAGKAIATRNSADRRRPRA